MEKGLLNTFDKELLMKDLCARLPYGVRYRHLAWDDERGEECIAAQIYSINSDGYVKNCYDDESDYIDDVHPYLFPLSSITEEQTEELIKLINTGQNDNNEFMRTLCRIEFFHKHHIDYRGLIEKSLAIDATGKNIY